MNHPTPPLRCSNKRCGYKRHYEHLRWVITRIWGRTQLVVLGERLAVAIADIIKDEGLMEKESAKMLANLTPKERAYLRRLEREK